MLNIISYCDYHSLENIFHQTVWTIILVQEKKNRTIPGDKTIKGCCNSMISKNSYHHSKFKLNLIWIVTTFKYGNFTLRFSWKTDYIQGWSFLLAKLASLMTNFYVVKLVTSSLSITKLGENLTLAENDTYVCVRMRVRIFYGYWYIFLLNITYFMTI